MITFRGSNLRNTTNSIMEIPEVGVQLREWRIILHLYVRQCVQLILGNGCTRFLLKERRVNLRVLVDWVQSTH